MLYLHICCVTGASDLHFSFFYLISCSVISHLYFHPLQVGYCQVFQMSTQINAEGLTDSYKGMGDSLGWVNMQIDTPFQDALFPSQTQNATTNSTGGNSTDGSSGASPFDGAGFRRRVQEVHGGTRPLRPLTHEFYTIGTVGVAFSLRWNCGRNLSQACIPSQYDAAAAKKEREAAYSFQDFFAGFDSGLFNKSDPKYYPRGAASASARNGVSARGSESVGVASSSYSGGPTVFTMEEAPPAPPGPAAAGDAPSLTDLASAGLGDLLVSTDLGGVSDLVAQYQSVADSFKNGIIAAAFPLPDSPWLKVSQSLFWTFIGFSVIMILHWQVLKWFRKKRKQPPKLAAWMKPELLLAFFIMPNFVNAAATLFAEGGAGNVTAGVAMLMILPVPVFAYTTYVIAIMVVVREPSVSDIEKGEFFSGVMIGFSFVLGLFCNTQHMRCSISQANNKK
jgi:hypothetical protein